MTHISSQSHLSCQVGSSKWAMVEVSTPWRESTHNTLQIGLECLLRAGLEGGQ